MATSLLFRFTPSLMQPDMLEAMFVQREELANRIIDQIRDSVLTSAKNHNLLIGPRGIGKSHLVSLIHHRIAGMDDLHDCALIAWMREEEWGVTSFLDLVLRTLRAVSEKYPDLIPSERLLVIQGTSRRIAEQEFEKLLRELLVNKVLVLIVENLDDMFNGLGAEGQKKLRGYLQDNQNCTILATAQSLFKGVSLHNSPFYGFFRIQHLAPLEFDDAVRLISNIATWLQDSDLAAFIKTPVGRARLRAVHHLAGGNHRVYVIFAEFLTRESLDELVSPFLRMLDDLTPYYQARMAWLSPHQRKIVEYLCEQRGAVPVKQIAQGCFISPQSASSQLKVLRDMGYVESTTNKRESFYELREPLMRLCIELKKNRGGPIRLLVDFLRLWHSRTELHTRLATLRQDKLMEREYLSYAIRENEIGESDLRIDACLVDFRKYVYKGDKQKALQVAEELVAIRGDSRDLVLQGAYLLSLGRYEEALMAADKVIELDPKSKDGWEHRAWALWNLDRHDKMLEAADTIIELDFKNIEGWQVRASALGSLDRNEEALAATDKIIELDPKNVEGWQLRAMALGSLDRFEEELVAVGKVIELDPKNIDGWQLHAGVLGILGRFDEALVAADKVIEMDPKNIDGWRLRAMAMRDLDRHDEQLVAVDKVIELDPKNIDGWEHRAWMLWKLDRHEEALVAVDKVIELDPKNIDGWRLRAIAMRYLDRHEEALVAADKLIELDPKNIVGWLLRAIVMGDLDRDEELLIAADKLIELDPTSVDGWEHRALALWALDRNEEMLAAANTIIELDPKNIDGWRLRAVAMRHLDRHEEALVAADKLIELDPKNIVGWKYRASALWALGRNEGMLAAADTIIELDPKNGEGWQLRAWALVDLHRLEESVACYDRVIAMGEDSPEIFMSRSEALIGINHWDEAILTLEEALSRLASSPASTNYDVESFVERLFEGTRDIALLRERVRGLIELHYKYARAASLGTAIVESIEMLTAPTVVSATRRSWFEIWQSLVGEKIEFQIPIRLLKAAVDYIESTDKRVLLELPSEERRLLMPLLGIEDKSQNPSA